MEDDMPMDELRQIRNSRIPTTTTSTDSIHPPQVVSPNNTMSDDAVSSVSSAEEPKLPRRRTTRPKQLTPPRQRTSKPKQLIAPTTPPRHSLRRTSFDAGETTPPRNFVRSASFDEGETSPRTPPRHSLRRASFDAAETTSPKHIGHNAWMDTADLGGGPPGQNVSRKSINQPSMGRLSAAILSKSDRRPTNLNIEEKALWDVVQGTLSGQRTEFLSKRRALERHLQESTSQVDKLRVHNLSLQQDLDVTVTHLQNAKRQMHTMKAVQAQTQNNDSKSNAQMKDLEDQVADLQQKYNKAVELTETCQEEHDRAIRAIQRVLADVNQQKEEQIQTMQARIKQLQDEIDQQQEENAQTVKDVADVATLRARARRAFQLEGEMENLKNTLAQAEKERDQLQQDLDKKAGQIMILEEELNVTKKALLSSREKEADCEGLIIRQRKQLTEQGNAHRADPDTKSSVEAESLQKRLQEKTKSLENAKALITSLEVANGSMAIDLRAKLKGKDEQVQSLQSEAADRRRTMDSLATELKDIQTVKIESDESGSKAQEHLALLAEKLDNAISDLQSATVVLEATGAGDEEVLDEIAVILCNTLTALKVSLAAMENGEKLDSEYFDRQSRAISGEKDQPASDVQETVQQMGVRLKLTEASLKQAEGEVKLVKLQNVRLQLSQEQEETKMQEEIRYLRSECKTNLEVLAKKKQELQVLRDSLEVGDGVGYISGDESDEEEEDQIVDGNFTTSQDTFSYPTSNADALATLLARSGVDMTDSVNSAELDKMKSELKKAERERQRSKEALKIEKESLANAKMIISSLEKANKTMLEDLRARLQDSNFAIAALLDKSMVNERSSKDLKEELKQIKHDKEKAEAEHQAQIAELKEKALVSAVRLAAKEREIHELTCNNVEEDRDTKEAKEREINELTGNNVEEDRDKKEEK